MQVLIHAGMQKTGSSALQEHLAACREELAGLGVIYPLIGDERGHWRLSAAVNHEFAEHGRNYFARRAKGRSPEQMGARALRTLREVLSGAGADDVVVLSHESFSNLKYAEGLASYLREQGVADEAVRVLAYARRPTEFYPSGVQQALKGIRLGTPPPSNWTYPHLRRAHGLWAVFGDRVTLRAHSRGALTDGDIVADFNQHVLARYGRRLPAARGESLTNVSYSGPACAILQAARMLPDEVNADDYILLKHRIIVFDRTRPRVPLALPPAWRDRIAAEHAESWNALVDRMDHPPEIAGTLRLEPREPGPEVTNKEVRGWLLSHHDPDYLRALAEWSVTDESKAIGRRERAAELLGLIERKLERRARRPGAREPIRHSAA